LGDTDVKYEIISRNSRIDAECKKKLKELNSYLKDTEVRLIQNKIKHKERLRVKELFAPALIEFMLKNNPNSFKQKEIIELKEDVNFYYKFYLKDKKEQMKSEIKKLKESTISTLDILYPKIRVRYESYEE